MYDARFSEAALDRSSNHDQVATHVPNDEDLNVRDFDLSTSRGVSTTSIAQFRRQLFPHARTTRFRNVVKPDIGRRMLMSRVTQPKDADMKPILYSSRRAVVVTGLLVLACIAIRNFVAVAE